MNKDILRLKKKIANRNIQINKNLFQGRFLIKYNEPDTTSTGLIYEERITQNTIKILVIFYQNNTESKSFLEI